VVAVDPRMPAVLAPTAPQSPAALDRFKLGLGLAQQLALAAVLEEVHFADGEVSHVCPCIGSPCLRQCVHGAPIIK
jgi:hypothetical protein